LAIHAGRFLILLWLLHNSQILAQTQQGMMIVGLMKSQF
jgi:hypothetical protein